MQIPIKKRVGQVDTVLYIYPTLFLAVLEDI